MTTDVERPPCPRPDKRAFATREAAEQSIRDRGMCAEPYQCRCGLWHARTPRRTNSPRRRRLHANHAAGLHTDSPRVQCSACIRATGYVPTRGAA